MGRKQRRQNKKVKIKKAIRTIILALLILITIYLILGFYKESKVRLKESEYTAEKAEITNKTEEEKEIKKVKIDYDIPKKYLGYEVSSILEIPKIKLKSNVLEEYTKQGLEVCLSKYFGPKPNEIGNYCIAGHNYNKENMFNHLIDLEIGDKIYLTDEETGKCEYEIYDIYRVKPQNTKPLSQATENKREITLITCVNYSRNRLIIKAVENKS